MITDDFLEELIEPIPNLDMIKCGGCGEYVVNFNQKALNFSEIVPGQMPLICLCGNTLLCQCCQMRQGTWDCPTCPDGIFADLSRPNQVLLKIINVRIIVLTFYSYLKPNVGIKT